MTQTDRTYYLFPEPDDPVRQGDIFKSLPYIMIKPEELRKYDNETGELIDTNWNLETSMSNLRVLATIEPVYGIVVTQDCDAGRDPFVTFAQVVPIEGVAGKKRVSKERSQANQEKDWIKVIIQDSYSNPKWFYLPPNEIMGFTEKMAADFRSLFPVRTEFVLQNMTFRIGRLSHVPDEHFRETLAQYFRRYPYNEWYPFTNEELEVYKVIMNRKDDDITPRYPWQE